jgi:cell division protein FtsB
VTTELQKQIKEKEGALEKVEARNKMLKEEYVGDHFD